MIKGTPAKLARELGLKKYSSTCKHHGEVFRWTSNGGCEKCIHDEHMKYIKRNKDVLNKKRKKWDKKNPEKSMIQRARFRSKKLGLDFNIQYTDIIIPEYCPILGILLSRTRGKTQDHFPTLDRIDNDKGYIKGNIVVVSHKVNRIKSNASLDELKKIVNFYERKHQ